MVIVQLSDLHIGAGDARDPVAEARAAVAAARRLDPAAVLVSGDVAEHGDPAEYALAREILAAFDVPVHVLGGNHDDRAALRAAFPDGGAGAERVHWTARCDGLRLIGCDSTIPGEGAGALAPAELEWLSARLEEDGETPTIVAMHHPAHDVGMPVLDEIGIPQADRDALGDVLAGHPQVRLVAGGHVHMATVGRLGHAATMTGLSTWTERAIFLPGASVFTIEPGPAGLTVHLIAGGRLVSNAIPL